MNPGAGISHALSTLMRGFSDEIDKFGGTFREDRNLTFYMYESMATACGVIDHEIRPGITFMLRDHAANF